MQYFSSADLSIELGRYCAACFCSSTTKIIWYANELFDIDRHVCVVFKRSFSQQERAASWPLPFWKQQISKQWLGTDLQTP
mmetsp:Transcript_17473/g.25833  ORF Transcript_17473/g.25833 Transcript_17473/m.25833 type:complete len:81 (-) Transcript_17473:1116-1358(-)